MGEVTNQSRNGEENTKDHVEFFALEPDDRVSVLGHSQVLPTKSGRYEVGGGGGGWGGQTYTQRRK